MAQRHVGLSLDLAGTIILVILVLILHRRLSKQLRIKLDKVSGDVFVERPPASMVRLLYIERFFLLVATVLIITGFVLVIIDE